MPSDKKLDLEGFDVDTSNVCTADGGFVGDVTGAVTGSVTGSWYISSSGTYTSDGAISLMGQLAVLDASSETTQMTLANATANNVFFISCKDATFTCDVDLNLYGSASTITFTAANQCVILVYNPSDKWVIVSNSGATIS